MSYTSLSSQFAVAHTPWTLGTRSSAEAYTFRRSRSFFSIEYILSTISNRCSRFGQSTAVRSLSQSNFSSSRLYVAISTNFSRATTRIDCLRSIHASRIAPPNRCLYRFTRSLSRTTSPSFGGAGGRGRHGAAGGFAAKAGGYAPGTGCFAAGAAGGAGGLDAGSPAAAGGF